jgi:phosphoribosylformylglycinamidine synthase PurS subunit
MRVKIFISFKEGVLDPQGKAVERSLHSLGYEEVRDVRMGKYLEIELEASSREAAEARIREMCDKLLANPVIEDYRFEIEEEPSAVSNQQSANLLSEGGMRKPRKEGL